MKRKIYETLLTWKKNDNGRCALLINGARRVGKSYIAEEFGKNEYKTYVLIDFSKAGRRIRSLFEEYLGDLDTFFSYLQAATKTRLYPRESLVIFDEVQEFPRAREAIKHLVKDGRYDFIETGSLVSINENVNGIVIPSEEEDVTMYPMDFEEFLWARGDETTMDFVKDCYAKKRPLGMMHRQVMDMFREYLIVGGMPQVVSAYFKNRDFTEADREKRRIISLYRKDIKKHAGSHALRVERIFDEIPGQLSKHEKKFNFSVFGKDARLRDYEDAVMWLKDAMVANIACRATEPNVGLALNQDSSAIKCYFIDTGLLVSHAFDTTQLNAQDVHSRILFDELDFNEGMIVENVVAQILVSAKRPLYFYSRHERGDRSESMEIDFLLAKSKLAERNNVIPVEAKSGKRLTHRALDKFVSKYHEWLDKPVVLSTRDLSEKNGVIYLPLYMCYCLT